MPPPLDPTVPAERSTSAHALETYVSEFGEHQRAIIRAALAWLDQEEPHWDVPRPTDRRAFLAALLRHDR